MFVNTTDSKFHRTTKKSRQPEHAQWAAFLQLQIDRLRWNVRWLRFHLVIYSHIGRRLLLYSLDEPVPHAGMTVITVFLSLPYIPSRRQNTYLGTGRRLPASL
jgi:hypothetical protein